MTAGPERQRLLADAIVLERARRVLERRVPGRILHDPVMYALFTCLEMYAAQWRKEAERDETLSEFLVRTQRPSDPLDTDDGRAEFLDAVLRRSDE